MLPTELFGTCCGKASNRILGVVKALCKVPAILNRKNLQGIKLDLLNDVDPKAFSTIIVVRSDKQK